MSFSSRLPWKVRSKIAVGTAQGLAYLHFDTDPAILHRDIKPENILLDSDMEPHISDFGIAKLLDQSAISIQSTGVPGTVGYIAPGITSAQCSSSFFLFSSLFWGGGDEEVFKMMKTGKSFRIKYGSFKWIITTFVNSNL